MKHPELLTTEQRIRNATEPFSRRLSARLLLVWRGILSQKRSHYSQFKSWFKKIPGKMSQRSRAESNTLGLLVSLNKRTTGRMLMLDSEAENWRRPSVIYPSVWIDLGDLSNDLVALLELPMMKVKALNVSSVQWYMAERKEKALNTSLGKKSSSRQVVSSDKTHVQIMSRGRGMLFAIFICLAAFHRRASP